MYCKSGIVVHTASQSSQDLGTASDPTMLHSNVTPCQEESPRRILGVTRRDHISNSDIKAKLKQDDDIVEKVQTSRLRYFGHVTRMDKCRLPYIALHGGVEGNRAKGRPRKRRLDNVTEDCKRRGWDIVEATRLAADRQYWRSCTRLSQHASALS